ncbi:DEKNAAC104949 [Brettanomyces naardenensis]|uniref:Cyclin-dependent kinase 8 n=1 Tax=Brettanomyces naardenensis TaxID=13370 RepID=A0A448YS77_BRENA|nr:DEKNAAC104949 [Brettanomyces naardenensis]
MSSSQRAKPYQSQTSSVQAVAGSQGQSATAVAVGQSHSHSAASQPPSQPPSSRHQYHQQNYPYGTGGSKPTRVASNDFFTIGPYRKRKDQSRVSVVDRYEILGYIAAGTYGKVYKARGKLGSSTDNLYAIKKFKTETKDNEVAHYTGISQSAVREMSLCKELNHKNISKLSGIILERKCIYMVFEFAEHDLLQIIHYHSHPEPKPIPQLTLKSAVYQILQGLSFLHQNWILHRDLKPANIMVTSDGVIKIGDLGLARKFNNPLQGLYAGDKVVVTIWYRAPELLLGARHYTPAIDMWAVGCILAELLSLRPLFKGEETKMDNKKQVPFQENQLLKILEILGTPTLEKWPSLNSYPEYPQLSRFTLFPSNLKAWYHTNGGTNKNCLKLLSQLLEYDPSKRINALDSLKHPWFYENPKPVANIFEGSKFSYPQRKIQKEDIDILGTGKGIYSHRPNYGVNNATKRGYPLAASNDDSFADMSRKRMR